MKNEFFEAFDEIDEKYISEAANAGYEESYAEEFRPTGSRKKICPAFMIKFAACTAAVGAAVFVFSAAAGIGKNDLAPKSSNGMSGGSDEFYAETDNAGGEQSEAVNTSSNENVLTEGDELSQDISTETDNADGERSEALLTSYSDEVPTEENGNTSDIGADKGNADTPPNADGLSEEEREAAREAARMDWESREYVRPTDDDEAELEDELTTKFGGWAGLIIPVLNKGSAVRAISYGEVVYAGFHEANMYHYFDGYFVVIKHNDYVYTGYSCIDPNPSLKVGDKVEAGQCVGYANLLWEDGRYSFSYIIGESNFARPVEYAE